MLLLIPPVWTKVSALYCRSLNTNNTCPCKVTFRAKRFPFPERKYSSRSRSLTFVKNAFTFFLASLDSSILPFFAAWIHRKYIFSTTCFLQLLKYPSLPWKISSLLYPFNHPHLLQRCCRTIRLQCMGELSTMATNDISSKEGMIIILSSTIVPQLLSCLLLLLRCLWAADPLVVTLKLVVSASFNTCLRKFDINSRVFIYSFRALKDANRHYSGKMTTWKNPFLYKSNLCDHYRNNGYCRYGVNCWYAHGNHELRTIPDVSINLLLCLSGAFLSVWWSSHSWVHDSILVLLGLASTRPHEHYQGCLHRCCRLQRTSMVFLNFLIWWTFTSQRFQHWLNHA